MPPTETEDRLFDMLSDHAKRATAERAALTGAFAEALAGLRWELRVMVLLLTALAMARDGILGTFKVPGVSIETRSAHTQMPVTAQTQEVAP